ncbi:MAG: glycosyltransferase [Pseudomonadota bacterium]
MPRYAIVIPSYNRPEQLDKCLQAATAQDLDDYEVVVVDDGSPVPLASVCEKYGDRVRCLRQSNAGPATARNHGAQSSDARFIAFTDDDCEPATDWLSQLVKAHGGNDNRLVGGAVVNALPNDTYASASQALCDFLYDYFGASDGTMPFFTSNNIGMSRVGYERLGGFNQTFERAAAEDRDFGLRWRDMGGEMVFAQDAVIDHFHAMTFRKYWRQHSNYGAGAFRLHQVLEERSSDQNKREPLSFYMKLILWPIRSGRLDRIHLSALMLLSQVAMVAGYASALRASKKSGS